MQSNTSPSGFAPREPVHAGRGLPEPSPEALAHSARVVDAIRSAIVGAGGWIPFSEYMRLALHAPGLGYYAAGSEKLGATGDFTTAPEMSPLFGAAVANQIAEVLDSVGGSILEIGAGSGRLAVDILRALRALGTPGAPDAGRGVRGAVHYAILETSADLRARQRQAIAEACPAAIDHVRWLDALPERWTGVIVGNEVLDAVPCEWVGRRDGAVFRRGVVVDAGGALALEDRADDAIASSLRDAIEQRLPGHDYLSEINPEAEALSATLAARLDAGLLLWIDYGFPAREYYHPQRTTGTLMCHYRHRAHDDVLLWPGLQDITAHVDFSAIADATCSIPNDGTIADATSSISNATAGHVELAGYASQASFLIDCGIVGALAEAGPPGSADFLRASNAVQRLLSPAEMGELFKAIAFTRNVDFPLCGFRSGDRSGRL